MGESGSYRNYYQNNEMDEPDSYRTGPRTDS